MMKKYMATAMALVGSVLAACNGAAPTDSVKSLAAHPDRLRQVEKACGDNYAKMGADECNAAYEARRRLFIGNGPRYTPPKDPPKF